MPRLIEHKTARRDFEILEEFEAGLELFGTEVKSLRAGHGTLTGSHVIVRGGEVYLVGMQIPPWQVINAGKDYDPTRTRRLLLTKKEIASMSGLTFRKGATIIPLTIFTKGRKLKIAVAVAKGKKKFDKREDIKKREDRRSMDRALKHHAQ